MVITGGDLGEVPRRRAGLTIPIFAPAGYLSIFLDSARKTSPPYRNLGKTGAWRVRLTMSIRAPTGYPSAIYDSTRMEGTS